MGRLIAELFETLNRALSHSTELVPFLFQRIASTLIRVVQLAVLPEVIVLFILSTASAALACLLLVALHIAFARAVRSKASVFISYQHQRQQDAESIAQQLMSRSIEVVKLPLVEQPDHDLLLDEIDDAINKCRIIVCLPGRQPSFVDHEIAMAFALRKALLFVLNETTSPFLPNTAKKGYPLFDLKQVMADQVRTLAEFCSYLAADGRSTMNLYLSVLHSLGSFIPIAAVIYLVLIVSLTAVHHAEPAFDSFRSLPTGELWLLSSITVTLFLISFLAFFSFRHVVRYEVRHSVAGRRFDYRALPETLQQSLSRADLQRIQYHGPALSMHAKNEEQPTGPLLISANKGRIIFDISKYSLLSVLFIWLFREGGWLVLWPLTWSSLIWPFLVLALAAGIVELAQLLPGIANRRSLVIEPRGITDELRNECGLIAWSNIESVAPKSDDSSIEFVLREPKGPITIDLKYYNISAEELSIIVSEDIKAFGARKSS